MVTMSWQKWTWLTYVDTTVTALSKSGEFILYHNVKKLAPAFNSAYLPLQVATTSTFNYIL
jgi:hypothetical protein